MLPRRVLGVVFDMDGLLIDSEVVYREAMMHVAKTQGHYLPSSVHLRMVGLPGTGVAGRGNGAFRRKLPDRCL